MLIPRNSSTTAKDPKLTEILKVFDISGKNYRSHRHHRHHRYHRHYEEIERNDLNEIKNSININTIQKSLKEFERRIINSGYLLAI